LLKEVPELVETVSMNIGASAVRVAPVERVLGQDRLLHRVVEIDQGIEDGEIRLGFGEIAHADQVDEDGFERSVAGSLPFAGRRAIDDGAAFANADVMAQEFCMDGMQQR